MSNVALRIVDGILGVTVGGVLMEGSPVVTFRADVTTIPNCDNPAWVEQRIDAQWVEIRLPVSAVKLLAAPEY